MKTLLFAAAAAVCISGAAVAGDAKKTTLMTDQQMDNIVAGVADNPVAVGGMNDQGAPKVPSLPGTAFSGQYHADQAARPDDEACGPTLLVNGVGNGGHSC